MAAPAPAVPALVTAPDGSVEIAPSPLYPAVTRASLEGAPTDPDAPPPTWPCSACRALVPLTADVCPDCGAHFLAGAGGASVSTRVPVLGVDLATQSKGKVYAVAGGAGLLLALLVIGVVVLVAAVF